MIWLLYAAIAAALVYEAITLVNKKSGDTISELVWTVSARRPLVPFALGFLMGHFFFRN